MMLPGMCAGWIYDLACSVSWFSESPTPGYTNFFFIVMVTCLVTYTACALVKIDPAFGLKHKSDLKKS